MKITVTLPDGVQFTSEYNKSVTCETILRSLTVKPKYPILGCQINHRNERLNTRICEDSDVRLFDMRNSYANMSYQMSLTLLYIKAVHDVAGKDVHIRMANSISKGLFTKVHSSMSKTELAKKTEERMRDLVKADLPILQVRKDRDRLLYELSKQSGFEEDIRLLKDAYDLKDAFLTTLDDEKHLFYQYLLPSTGYLSLFEVRKYRKGIVLRFPHPSDPNVVLPFEEQNLLYEAFSEERNWEHLLGLNDVSDLNEKVLANDYVNTILLSEALHEKKIADIANMIHERGSKIILIAGPSSSGKTSFAKRLCIQLQVIGYKPLYLGTDDYFINRADLPLQEDGTKDFESLSAVDVDLFTKQMNALLNGEEVDLPEYDFILGEKVFGKRIVTLQEEEIIVIEGIHGLNPALTEGIDDQAKFKIYISPLTQLTLDRYHRIPTTDARMLRRLVRDYRTRGSSAQNTIAAWPSVRSGEEKNIFPYNGQADVFFNSQCVYELAVLKKYAEPLLKRISREDAEYAEAQRMLKFLEFFVSIPNDSFVPNNSIIREFIGGSIIAK